MSKTFIEWAGELADINSTAQSGDTNPFTNVQFVNYMERKIILAKRDGFPDIAKAIRDVCDDYLLAQLAV